VKVITSALLAGLCLSLVLPAPAAAQEKVQKMEKVKSHIYAVNVSGMT